MANKLYSEESISAIARAIRAKNGSSDTYTVAEMAQAIEDIPSGGTVVEKKDVNFYDLDGTRLYSYTKAEFLELENLPEGPAKRLLAFNGWNWRKEEITSYVTKYGSCDNIGAQYKMADNTKSYMVIDLPAGCTNIELGLYVNGTVTIDWGDESATSSVTGTSLSEIKYAKHEYIEPGEYIIELSPDQWNRFTFEEDTNNLGSVLHSGNYDLSLPVSAVNTYYTNYEKYIKELYLGVGFNINSNSYYLAGAGNIKYLVLDTLNHDIESFSPLSPFNVLNSNIDVLILHTDYSLLAYGNGSLFSNSKHISMIVDMADSGGTNTLYTFSGNIKSIILPKYLNLPIESGSSSFTNLKSLEFLSFAGQSAPGVDLAIMTAIPDYAFENCVNLKSITIPEYVESFCGMSINGCVSLENITLPETVDTIEDGSHNPYMPSNTGLSELHLETTSIEVLYRAYNIQYIELPSTLEQLYLDGISNGITLKMHSSQAPTLNNDSSAAWPSNVTVYIPRGSRNSYEDTWQLWNIEASNMTLIEYDP